MVFRNEAYKSVMLSACLVLTGSAAKAQFFSFFRSQPAAQETSTPAPVPNPVRHPVVSRLASPAPKPKPKPAPVPVLVATTPEEVQNTRLVSSQMADVARKYGLEMAFRLDPTLRRGDVVVVNAGLHVFSGRHGRSHAVTDFRSLARSELSHKPQLTALQKVGKYEALAPGTKSAFTEVLTIRAPSRFVEVKASLGFKEIKPVRR
jgi:hypothetical protein